MQRKALVVTVLSLLVLGFAFVATPVTSVSAGDAVSASPAPATLPPLPLSEQKERAPIRVNVPALPANAFPPTEVAPTGPAPVPFATPTTVMAPGATGTEGVVVPGTPFSLPATPPTTEGTVTTTARSELPEGWQHHTPGQVVWSSEGAAGATHTTYPTEGTYPAEGVVESAPYAEGTVLTPGGPAVGEVVWSSEWGTASPEGEVISETAMPDAGADMGGRAAVRSDQRRFLVESFVEKAREALRNADIDGARGYLAQALDLDPANAEARELWSNVSVDRAQTAGDYGRGRSDTANAKREKAAIEVRNYLERGRTLEARERYDEAAKEYKKALAILSWYDQTADFGTSADRVRDLIDAAGDKARVSARRARQEQIRLAQSEREEELLAAREQRLGRIRAWFEGAHRAFRRGEYVVAREYAKQIKRADPTNTDAERIIEMSYDAEHSDAAVENRRLFDEAWKSIMLDLEESSLPQVDTVVFPENWLDDISQRKPRAVGDDFDTAEAGDAVAIQSILDKKRVQGLTWEEANLDTAVDYLRTITGLNFYITPKVRQEEFENVAINLGVSDVNVTTVLDLITEPYNLRWTPKGGVIWVTTADEVKGEMRLRYFDVKDLSVNIRDFATDDLNLVPSNFTPPEPPELPEPEPIYAPEALAELIQATIGGESAWEEGTITPQNGILIVRNTPEILAQIDDLLNQLRASTGLLVNLEVRFLTAEDNFLRDVGVDVRGLGSGVAPVAVNGQGPAVVQDDVFFGTAANPFGVAFGRNPEPSSVGTANDAGIFYGDGGDGAYAARVENLFDEVVRGFGDPEVLTRSGGLSFQHTFLDDTALEVILRAVEKSERVQSITSPRITVYNTQRANISVLNQISYVQDYEVEIAQASNIANPVIQTIQEGVVLDVRPVVSADRRFVTLELRPSLAVVQRPIAEFTTNLAAGPIGANAPVTLQVPELRVQRVRTTVTMPDGGTLLLGGMKFYEKDVRESGVPFLSRIPVLSFLLSRKGNFVNRRNLLVLITARIVPLEELEPKDDMSMPPAPERSWIPIRELENDCGPCANGQCGVPVAADDCGCAPKPARAPCNTCR